MASKTLPEQLRSALQYHIEQADLRDEPDMPELLDRLAELSSKVKAAKQKALARRKTE